MSHAVESDDRLLSAVGLKARITVFMVLLLAAMSALTYVLVAGISRRFEDSVREDLRWKALRGAREIAQAADVAIALGDGKLILEAFGDYKSSPDVGAVVAVDAAGKPLARLGAAGADEPLLFSGPEGRAQESALFIWSWFPSRIEQVTVGRVAIAVSLRRLDEGRLLRRKLLALAGGGCVVALVLGFAFVSFHIGPVFRFAERTLLRLRALNASLEDQVASRTKDLVATNARLEEGLARIGSMQRQLADASRRAGMADVATTVLHNVGNVLNSVNVSSGLVMDTVRKTPLVGLGKAVELLRTNQGDLAAFFAADSNGEKLVAYLGGLSAAEERERELVLRELELLQKNIDHIKVIVGRQQTYAKAVGTVEMVVMSELLDDAINLQRATAAKQGIEIVRQFDEVPAIKVDRHKLFQIVMNLLGNARQALADNGPTGRRIVVRLTRRDRSRLSIEVEDTGCGIAAENLTRIFSHGFTTKKDGHGFGLHGASCSAMEMGGALAAHSEGPGTGARFTLELPMEPPSGRASAAA